MSRTFFSPYSAGNQRPAQLSSVRQIGTELLTGTAQFDVAAAAILP